MHQKLASSLTGLSAGALFILATLPAAAQQAAIDTAQSTTTTQQLQKPLLAPGVVKGQIPLLYEGEAEDTGEQYVLQPKEAIKYFQFLGDLQLYRANNPTLAPANKTATDVSVLTLQVVAHTEETEWFDGFMGQTRAGLRFQDYWYGVFSDRDHIITGAPIKYSDFTTISPYVEMSLRSDDWYGSLGLRYSSYDNNNALTSGTFYQEYVPYGTVGYQWNLADKKTLQFQYDGDFRKTNTHTAGLLPTGWNDRADNALSLIYSVILGEHWVIQPSYRFMWSRYTNDQRSRSDVYNTFSMLAAYYFNEMWSARVFTSYEWRSSSEIGNNYQSWNFGVGLSVNAAF